MYFKFSWNLTKGHGLKKIQLVEEKKKKKTKYPTPPLLDTTYTIPFPWKGTWFFI